MDTLQPSVPPALGDRYLLCELLGSGGMAEVYRARDLRLDRSVAVKVLRPELAADPVQRVRFGREARAAASLNHPGIVAVFDSGDGAGPRLDLPYLVMEYLPGRTLAQLLAEDGPLPPRQALDAVADILDALDHAHRHGMVHRDVKPANVMVVGEAVGAGLTGGGLAGLAGGVSVKLMDFGIARGSGRGAAADDAALTATGLVVGTADYLSPEQARGETADARSDLYAVGCLLHELLTGRAPLLAETPLDTVWRRLREDPEPPSLLVPSLPPELDALVLRSLARDPAERHRDASAMAAAVRALRAGLEAGTGAAAGAAAEAGAAAGLGSGFASGVSLPSGAHPATLVELAPGDASASAPTRALRRREGATGADRLGGPGVGPDGPGEGSRRPGRRDSSATRPRGRRFMAATAVAVVAAAVSVGGWLASGGAASGAASGGAKGTHALPTLTGQSLSRARHELQALGLHLGRISVGPCTGTKAAPRTVCTQTPAPGTALPRGAAVTLSVSRAPGIAAGAGAP